MNSLGFIQSWTLQNFDAKEIQSITNDELERASCASTIDRISDTDLSFSSSMFFRRKLSLFHVSSVSLGWFSLQNCVVIIALGDSEHRIGSARKNFAALLDNNTSKCRWFMGFYLQCQTTILGGTHLSLIRNICSWTCPSKSLENSGFVMVLLARIVKDEHRNNNRRNPDSSSRRSLCRPCCCLTTSLVLALLLAGLGALIGGLLISRTTTTS